MGSFKFLLILDNVNQGGLIMHILKIISYILVIVGAINWGLVGILKFDLVAAIFGEMSTLTRLTYSIVGVCGLYSLFAMYRNFIDEV